MTKLNYPSPAWGRFDLARRVVQVHDLTVMIRIDDRLVEMAGVDWGVSGMQLVVRRIRNRGLQPFHPFLMSCLLPFGVVGR
jgi:hypothetical protein